ncbi:MAG: 3-isopropylmalate dehydratase small subunit [Rhodospirillaceae bacterium]|nr:3-isopropylmalate dehydratase small subunit [Rhodospirillaceae bacterium]
MKPQPFTVHRGIAAPLLTRNIDTDTIIPSREIQRVSKQGLGDGLFAGWRYRAPGSREPDPEFILNLDGYHDASILLAGANFGCGSSREHAVWALGEFGIRALLAPSFGSIFRNNCTLNGILAVIVEDAVVRCLADWVQTNPRRNQLKIDLQNQVIEWRAGGTLAFEIEPAKRRLLLKGLDSIAVTLQQASAIDEFEVADSAVRPWVYRLPESPIA